MNLYIICDILTKKRKNMDKISVIVPVSNSQKYLTQCLDSIIYQTYCELEIILVNDFSIDESEKIILEYQKKDKRINFIKNHKTKGAALAKNSALEILKGKYVFFLEACDFLDINAIKNAYLEIKDSNSDIVITKTVPFDECDMEYFDLFKSDSEEIIKEYFEVKINNFEYAISNFPDNSWGKLYNSDFLKKNKIFFINKNVICENEGFFLKVMSKLPKISSIDSTGVNYRLNCRYDKLKNPKIAIKDAMEYIKKNSSKKDFKVFYDAILKMYDYLGYSLNFDEKTPDNIFQK